MKLRHLAATAALAFGFVAGAHAATTILNISATSGIPVSATFGPGTYTVNWIDNTAKGGYNGWTYNTGGSYREAFSVSGLPNNTPTLSVDKYTAPFTTFQSYSTAAAALAAVQAGPYVLYKDATDGNLYAPVNAVVFTLTSTTTLQFGIPDVQLSDNCCGVSLAITSSNVPEPGSYPLVLAGIGAMAFVGMRRKSVSKTDNVA